MMTLLPRTYRHTTTIVAVVLISVSSLTTSTGETVPIGEETTPAPQRETNDYCFELAAPEACLCPGEQTDATEPFTLEPVPPVSDRFWMISTRSISSSACRIDLENPNFSVYRLECNGCSSRVTLGEYFSSLGPDRSAVVYVHGNRIKSRDAIRRGMSVYRNICRYSEHKPIDWVMWSWPSTKRGILMHDVRRNAMRTDAQGLYLSWVLREHVEREIPTTLIGFSFGGRVVTGALHSLAGGKLGGRTLPGEPTSGSPFDAGLVAPAIDSHWLSNHGYHSRATLNLDRLVLLYNRRDAILKRYWLLDRVRGRMALGYSGPRLFSPRFDGSKLPVLSRDCSSSIGWQHAELDYYRKSCHAGSFMANLINDVQITH